MNFVIKLSVGFKEVYIEAESKQKGVDLQNKLPCSSILYDENKNAINTVNIPNSPRSTINSARYLYIAKMKQEIPYKPVDEEMYKWYSSIITAMDKHKFVFIIGLPDVPNNDILEVLDIYYRIKNKYTDHSTPGLWLPNFHDIIEAFKTQKDLADEKRFDILRHYSIYSEYAHHIGLHNIYATDENFYSRKNKTFNILQEIIGKRINATNSTILSTNEGLASFHVMMKKDYFNTLLDHSYIGYIDRPKGKI